MSHHQFDSPLSLEQCVAQLKLLSEGNVWLVESIHIDVHSLTETNFTFRVRHNSRINGYIVVNGTAEVINPSTTRVQFQATFAMSIWFFMAIWSFFVIFGAISGLVQGRYDQFFILLIFMIVGVQIARQWWKNVDRLTQRITRHLTQL
jgi:hypothetical protein